MNALGLVALLGALTASPDADVVVYGATPGGIAAALGAARGGQSVLLVEPTNRIGGMLTNGLSYSDFRSFESLSGFFLQFARLVESDYGARYGPQSPQVKASWRGTHGEPSVNLRVLQQMLAAQPRVRLLTGHVLGSVDLGPLVHGRRRILAVRLQNGARSRRVGARMFIDGSYEGDLLARAGEPYHVGRESRAQYGEPLAGDADGNADGQVQGYNLRLVMTARDDNERMPVAPPGYQRQDFVGVLAHFASGRLTKVFSPGRDGIYRAHLPLLPNEKADVNDTPHAPVRLSLPELSADYPEADAATRARLVRAHVLHNVGLLYFLQNDPAVPPAIRADARRWGLARDEFTETDGIPPQIYVREARRMIGQHVFTGRDTVTAAGDARATLHPDAIATGDYIHNCHGTGHVGGRFDGHHEGEFFQVIQPFQVPYGVIVPQRTENLLVPVAVSASHFGFGALRLEPIWASLGQAAGWAAHLAIASQRPVQRLDVPALQRLLHAEGSATLYVSDVAPDAPLFAAVQWFGLRGAFHGLVAVAKPLAPKPIAGQYTAAIPGHTVDLERPLDPALRARWESLLPADQRPVLPATVTRGAWLKAAFQASTGL